MRTSFQIAVASSLALLVCAASASAQGRGRPERPYRGLFGGGYGDSDQTLTLNASFGGGYDGNVLLGVQSNPSPNDLRRSTASTVGDASIGLSYGLSRKRVSVNAGATGAATYYPSLPKPTYYNSGGGAGARVELSKRTSVSFQESVAYRPIALLPSVPLVTPDSSYLANQAFLSKLNASLVNNGQDPVDLGPTTPSSSTAADLGAVFENHLTWNTNAAFSYRATQRVTLSATFMDSKSTSSSHDFDLSTRGYGGMVGFTIARGIGLHFGYNRTWNDYGTRDGVAVARLPVSNIDVGLDLKRSLSLTRRMSVSFGTSIVGVQYADQLSNRRSTYYLAANVAFLREIGRTWQAGVSYNRGVNYVEVFRVPLFSDSVGVSFGGLLNRRVQIKSGAGLSRGSVGLSATDNRYRAIYANAGVSLGLGRAVSISVDYSFYRYRFESGVALPSGLSNQSDRHSIHASINLFEPLFTRTRRPDATR